MARQREQFIERRAPLSAEQKEMMMVVLIRSRTAFEAVADKLRPEHFPPQDKKFAMLWAITVDYFDAHGSLPNMPIYEAEIQSRINASPEELSPDEIADLDKFVFEYAFKFRKKDLRHDYAIKKVKEMMEDSLHASLSRSLNERDTPMDLGRLLGNMQQEAVTIASMDIESDLPFPEDESWKPAANRFFTTGVDFLDVALDGGQTLAEIYTIIGPYASCKTLLGLQICIYTGEYFYLQWLAGGCRGPCPVVYYASAEAPIEELRLRAISLYAGVHKNSIKDADAWATRSTRGHLKPYEIALFGPNAMGEVERMRACQRLLNKFWCPFDLSGRDKRHQGRGQGGIEEIESLIRAEQRNRKDPKIGVVVIDYAQTIADRYIMAHLGGDRSQMRHIVGRMPAQVSFKIAKAFDTPCWLLAQFNKKGNTGRAGSLPTHSEAAEASNLAENCDFAFTIGAKQEGNFCLIGPTKARRAELQQPIPVWIDGAMNIVRGRSREMRVDPATQRIVKKEELSRVIAASEDDDDTPQQRRQRQAGDEVHFLGNQ